MDKISTLLASISLAGSAAYVLARWKGIDSAAAVAKIAASTAFVVLAVVNEATQTLYGRTILVALVFSWLGDMLLLSLKSSFLLAGIASFFVAHIAFGVAFSTVGLSTLAFAIALTLSLVLGVIIMCWLWSYLKEFYRIAVPAYLAAVSIMVALAVAASAESLPVTVAIGAIIFAISDISVARDRFVENSITNKAWGLPLYYLAQILFALSVIYGGA
jgi:uncharacterized membrane protein YhhN